MAEVQAVPEWVVEWLDPRTLLTDKNVREVTPDEDLIESIRAIGVLQPIIAVRTAEGQVRVRYGENRTRSAIVAERPLVPVIVVGADRDTDTEEIARIISQRAENTYRKGMRKSEDAAAARQLSLLGLSDNQIAEDLRMPKAAVKASKVIAGSAVATQLLDEYDLDLTQLAIIAKFDGNQERVDELVKKARNRWGFDQAVERMRTGIALGLLQPLPHRGLGQIEVHRDLTNRPLAALTQLDDLGLELASERTTRPWLLLAHGLHDEHPSGTEAPDPGCPSKRVKFTSAGPSAVVSIPSTHVPKQP